MKIRTKPTRDEVMAMLPRRDANTEIVFYPNGDIEVRGLSKAEEDTFLINLKSKEADARSIE